MRKLLSLICLMFIVACGESSSATEQATTGTTQQQQIDQTSASTNGPLVTYSSAGGLAGITTVTEVWSDGTANVSQQRGNAELARGTGTIDPALFSQLNEVVTNLETPNLQPEYIPTPPVPDAMTYTITTAGQTVTTTDGADWPPTLAELIDLLGQIQAQVPLEN